MNSAYIYVPVKHEWDFFKVIIYLIFQVSPCDGMRQNVGDPYVEWKSVSFPKELMISIMSYIPGGLFFGSVWLCLMYLNKHYKHSFAVVV